MTRKKFYRTVLREVKMAFPDKVVYINKVDGIFGETNAFIAVTEPAPASISVNEPSLNLFDCWVDFFFDKKPIDRIVKDIVSAFTYIVPLEDIVDACAKAYEETVGFIYLNDDCRSFFDGKVYEKSLPGMTGVNAVKLYCINIPSEHPYNVFVPVTSDMVREYIGIGVLSLGKYADKNMRHTHMECAV